MLPQTPFLLSISTLSNSLLTPACCSLPSASILLSSLECGLCSYAHYLILRSRHLGTEPAQAEVTSKRMEKSPLARQDRETIDTHATVIPVPPSQASVQNDPETPLILLPASPSALFFSSLLPACIWEIPMLPSSAQREMRPISLVQQILV